MPSSGDKQQRPSKRSSRPRPRASEGELRRFEPVTDIQILAAIERAEVHNERDNEGVLRSDLAEHLGFVHNGWTTRQLRPQLDALRSAGLLKDLRRHGLNLVAITSAGQQALARARKADQVGELPESPQHRRWRHARTAATDRIDGFRQQLRDVLAEAGRLLEAQQVPSDAWLSLAERLKTECWRLGSAMYCLGEWPEPDDGHADLDSGEFRGRRNIWRWEER
jgi:DNA-binding PadR family transcriptional regulator